MSQVTMNRLTSTSIPIPEHRTSRSKDGKTFRLKPSVRINALVVPLKLNKLFKNIESDIETAVRRHDDGNSSCNFRASPKSGISRYPIKFMNIDVTKTKKSDFYFRTTTLHDKVPSKEGPNTGIRALQTFTNLNRATTHRMLNKSNLKEQIELEKIKSERKLKKLEEHLRDTSCFTSRIKDNYYGIIKQLDNLKIKRLESDLRAKTNNMSKVQYDSSPFVNCFPSEVKIKNLDDFQKYKGKALKVYDMVNNAVIWKRT